MSDEDETFTYRDCYGRRVFELAFAGKTIDLPHSKRACYKRCYSPQGKCSQMSAVKTWNGSDNSIPISGLHAVVLVVKGSKERLTPSCWIMPRSSGNHVFIITDFQLVVLCHGTTSKS